MSLHVNDNLDVVLRNDAFGCLSLILRIHMFNRVMSTSMLVEVDNKILWRYV